jgi:hypothetical protein
MTKSIRLVLLLFAAQSCGIYSPYGASTSGAKTCSVAPFDPVNPYVSASAALTLTESLRDRIQRQSTLRLVDESGELAYRAEVIDWNIAPINIQGDETAAANRLTIKVEVHYENTLEPELSVDKVFSRFADYTSDQDLSAVEDALVEDIGDQLSQDIFNATLGNW